MTDPHASPASPGDPRQAVVEGAVTRVVNVGRAGSAVAGSTLAPIRPSALLSERLHRPTMAGRFVLTGEIARGGMGVIYRGHDPDLGRDLAIKVLKPERVEDADIVAMFFNEARICGRLQHPGVVAIHELGTMADGSPFIAMKLVEGQTFERLLAERGRSAHELQRVLRIFEVVCQTLAYAHASGVVHRDLKPSNIMVGSFGEVQVMDWGLACLMAVGESDPPPLDAENHLVMGTPAYMAPEQARRGATQNARVDVFALGAILCEILTGAPPFAEGDGATIERVSGGETQPALDRLVGQGLDADLVDLACRCLAVDPARRPGDAGLIARALGDHQSNVQERLRQAELQRAAAEARAVAERGSRRLLLGLTAVILVGSVGGWIGWEKSRHARADVLAARAVHVADEARMVEAALAEARLFQAEARGEWADSARWSATLARARAAVERAAGLIDGKEDLDIWESAVEEARLDLDADDRDRRLVRTFERLRMDKADDPAGALRRYEQAFAGARIDLFGASAEVVAARLRESALRGHLVEAIEDWACLLKAGEERRHRLLGVASWVEPHPWRDRLRDALGDNDRARLLRLAEDAIPSLSPACLVRLADALVSREVPDRAIALLRRAREAHPGDFWVNYQLGYRLHQAGPESLVEALRYYTAAHALRPDDPSSSLAIADVDRRLGRIREAEKAAPGVDRNPR